ncbi:MAG: sodium:solute symporter family protein [Bacillota bacterium]
MDISTLTLLVVGVVLGFLALISYLASKYSLPTPNDFYLAGRTLGTPILLMNMGATYFSAWTILGAVGSFYRSGVSFMVFPAWTIIHAVLIWVLGVRIWLLGKKKGFITPGDMMEDYYGSPVLRVLFAVLGIIALVPYMLIQVTGGALTFEALTKGEISYGMGVIITSVLVCIFVIIAGFRGTAWTDTAMGIFFGTTLLGIAVYFINHAGGLGALKTVADVNSSVLISNCQWKGTMGTATGLLLGFIIMPHMWQKYYAARSPRVLAQVSIFTPFWNSWLMAIVPFFIGVLSHVPGLVPGLTVKNSDTIVPLFFAHYSPVFGTFVAAAILTFAISTINSQLLTSSSLITQDIYTRFFNKNSSEKQITLIGKFVVVILTGIILGLAFTPGGAGYLIPVANLGFAIGIQLLPASLGPLYWPRGTKEGAIASIIAGEIVVIISQFILPFGIHPTVNGLIAASVTYYIVSKLTKPIPYEKQLEYHGYLTESLCGENAISVKTAISTQISGGTSNV